MQFNDSMYAADKWQLQPKQLLLVMKCTAILLLATCLTASAGGFSQTITLHQRNAPLEKVFKEISRQSGVEFLYTTRALAKAKPVSLRVTNAGLPEVLKLCFDEQPFTYEQIGKTIVVKAIPAEQGAKKSIFPILVKGKVTDEKGVPLAGVSIVVKGKKGVGTTTDVTGHFSIQVEEGAIMVVSSVGYLDLSLKINSKENNDVSVVVVAAKQQTNIPGKLLDNVSTQGKHQTSGLVDNNITSLSIVLVPEISSEQAVEVVSTGYWKDYKRSSTGNISKVASSEIGRQPVLNPLQSLQGRMTGVYITQQSGNPGAGFNIQIRGQNSLRTEGNYPLYIIDGVPFPAASLGSGAGSLIILEPSPLNNINPADIESIEVLKDADATAIYGSRGANGVVLITTKKGRVGETVTDFNISRGIGQVPKKMDLLSTEQYLEMRYEAFANDGVTPGAVDYDVNGVWDQKRYTDWQEVLIGGTAQYNNAQLAVSGGNANTQFLVRANYSKQTTVYPGDFAFQRGSGHFNLNHRSENQKFHINITANFTSTLNNLPNADLTRQASNLAPNAPELYNEDGALNWANSTWANPIAQLLKTYEARSNNLIANASLNYEIMHGLQLKTKFAFNKVEMEELSLEPSVSYNPVYNVLGSSEFGNGYVKTWIVEPQIDYQTRLIKGKLSALLGMTFQQSIGGGRRLLGRNYTSDALLENIAAAPAFYILSNNDYQYRYHAVYGRLNYNLNEKYIINITGRRDGSSRFGPGKQFANFGAVGAAWIFTNESFLKHSRVLSFGKIRASYGTTGSDQIGNYGYLDSYRSTSPYLGASLLPSRIANPEYSWEVNRKLEAGLESGFFSSRIFISASWFRNRSSNQLVGQSLPAITGFSSFQANLPATVQNTGWEFELRTSNIHRREFSWISSVNLTILRNKLLAYPNIAASSYRDTWEVGESLFKTKKVHWAGVDPQTGIYVFEDLNGDGALGVEDRRAIGRTGQDFYGGFENRIKYKNWELIIFFQFTKQTVRSYQYNFGYPGRMNNQPTVVMQRWQKPGDITDVQRFFVLTSSDAYQPAYYGTQVSYSDYTLVSGSFIRLQNASLSWRLPNSLAQSLHLKNGRIYLQGQNLFTLTDYIGFDPENAVASVLPPLRIVTFGVQFSL